MPEPLIEFRNANLADLQIIFEWIQDPEVRAAAMNTEPISLETHTSWFQNKLNDPQSTYWMIESRSHQKPLGQIRFDRRSSAAADIGIVIAPEARGRGLGAKVLSMATQKYFDVHEDILWIDAWVKISNPASVKIFERAGFQILDTPSKENRSALHLRLLKPFKSI